MKLLTSAIMGAVFLMTIINFVSAQENQLSCQYKELKESNSYKYVYYANDGTKFEDVINITNIKMGAGKDSPTYFDIINNLPYKIKLNVSYDTYWHDSFHSSLSKIEREIEMKPLETITIRDTHENGNTEIKNFQFKLFSTEELDVKLEKIIDLACKQCDRKDCLNDNIACKRDSECGSGICNIAGYCGKNKVVDCPNGLKNCNNQSCVSADVKKAGESYSCEFECKTNYGEEGICKISMKEKISKAVFIFVFLIIAVLVVYLILSEKKIKDIARNLGKTKSLKAL